MGLQLKKIGQIPASLGGSVASQKEKPYINVTNECIYGSVLVKAVHFKTCLNFWGSNTISPVF